jgi:hypothetical protein
MPTVLCATLTWHRLHVAVLTQQHSCRPLHYERRASDASLARRAAAAPPPDTPRPCPRRAKGWFTYKRDHDNSNFVPVVLCAAESGRGGLEEVSPAHFEVSRGDVSGGASYGVVGQAQGGLPGPPYACAPPTSADPACPAPPAAGAPGAVRAEEVAAELQSAGCVCPWHMPAHCRPMPWAQPTPCTHLLAVKCMEP